MRLKNRYRVIIDAGERTTTFLETHGEFTNLTIEEVCDLMSIVLSHGKSMCVSRDFDSEATNEIEEIDFPALQEFFKDEDMEEDDDF